MSLWIPWWNAIRRLRPAFSRLRTFLWFATAVAGFTVRTELLGVTSLVLIASSFVRTGARSRNMTAVMGAERRSTIPGITCQSWPANPEHFATGRRSRIGCCRPGWTGTLRRGARVVPLWTTGTAIRDEVWPLLLEYLPHGLLRSFRMGMHPGVTNAFVGQPGVQFIVGFDPQAGCEEALPHQTDLILNLPLLPS